jgi:hypothetical protein
MAFFEEIVSSPQTLEGATDGLTSQGNADLGGVRPDGHVHWDCHVGSTKVLTLHGKSQTPILFGALTAYRHVPPKVGRSSRSGV